ncbi:MAG: response regulator [Rhodocyclaceae bacterium]|nr:response regulator [Rhodocyclaceae bacterium]
MITRIGLLPKSCADCQVPRTAILPTTLRLFLPLAVLILALAWWEASRTVDEFAAERLNEAAHDAEAGSQLFLRELGDPLRHVANLAREHTVRREIESGDEHASQFAGTSFSTLLSRNPQYDQVRWIDETGRERLRYVHADGIPRRVADQDLRDLSGRDYFVSAMRAAPGQIYLSAIELSVEQGRAVVPHKPLLRVAVPVSDSKGAPRGILVINVLAAQLLDAAAAGLGEPEQRSMVVNGAGYWLRASDPQDEWGFMFGRDVTLAKRHPDAWAQMQNAAAGKFASDSGLWAWHTITPPGAQIATSGMPWRTVVKIDPSLVDAKRQQIWLRTTAIASLALALCGLLCVGLARWRVERDAALVAAGRANANAAAAAERLVAQHKLHELSELLGNLVNSSEDAIISTTPDGLVTSWNPAAERLYGYTAAEMRGQPLDALFAPGAEQAERQARAQVLSGATLRGFETVNRNKEGLLIDIAASISALRDAEGGIVGIARIARDVTQDKLLTHELQTHREHLEELVANRTEALSAAKRDIEQRERFIRTVTDHLPGTVSYWDSDLVCHFANRAYRDWFGMEPDSMLGRQMSELFGGTEWYARKLDAAKAALAGEARRVERSVVHNDGHQVHAVVDFIPDRSGAEIRGMYVLATDISAIKEAELQLRQTNSELSTAVARADGATVAKSAFLATMSHEIRTPLSGIMGLASLIERQPLAAETRAMVTKISGAGRTLMRIINDILDFSKVEAGKLELESTEFSLQDLVDEVAAMVATLPGDKPIDLVFEPLPPGLPMLRGDPLRLQQILVNFLSNAIKFTNAGHVLLGVETQPAAGGRLAMRFFVRDTGPGIAEQRQAHIFEPFGQENSSTARQYGGTGLGLAICRQLVELMGGRIGLVSAPDQGSEFWFSVELEAMQRAAPAAPDLGGLTVLVVSTQAVQRNSLAQLLSNAGATVDSAAMAASARERLAGGAYDLVLMDANLPDASGLALADALRAAPASARTRSILVASAAERDTFLRETETGDIGAVLARPLTLTAVAETALRLCRGEAAAGAGNTAAAPSAALRLRGLRALVVDDTEINCEVARGLLEAEGASVATADGGAAAIELLQRETSGFDIVLMDVQMPHMDGFEATRRIRQLPSLANLPIVALTAGALNSQREAALAAGLDDYLTKPLDLDAIVRVISQRCVPRREGQSGAAAAGTATAPASAGSMTELPGLDVATGMKLCRQPRIYARALDTFCNNYGNSAAQLAQFAQTGAGRELKALAHKLRGVAANLGMHGVASAAAALEEAAGSRATEHNWQELAAACAPAVAEAIASAKLYVASRAAEADMQASVSS